VTPELFLTVALNGVTIASLYFIVAVGFSLIFGLMRVVNMAHGSLVLIGAYLGIAAFNPLYDAGDPYAWTVALVVGIAAAGICGVILQVVFLGWMQGQELRQTLVTIGISIIVADQLLAIFGGDSQQFFAPDILFGAIRLPFVQGGQYPAFRLFQVAVALAVGIGLWLLLHKTRLGIIIRAGVDDRAMLAACGLNVPLVAIAVFALGAGLAGLGGVIGGTAQPFGQGKDVQFLLTSLIVVIVGGMGSLGGTAIGALLVGLAEQFGQAIVPTYSVILTLLLMVIVLAVRPQGIMGRRLG
jgi:branched-chain amino acid transport system permease protein